MKKIKIKNEFEEEQEKNKNKSKQTYTQHIKERMGEYYEEKPSTFHAKRKKDNYREILDVTNKNNENVITKKPMKAQTMTVGSKRVKTKIKHPRQRKNAANKKWQKIIQNFCYLENLTLIPKNLDKLLLFHLKKTSEEKIFDSILDKIPEKRYLLN